MVSERARSVFGCTFDVSAFAQIPWGDEFEHDMGRELFASNLLALTWIKGEPMPGELVDEILRGLGLERETDDQRRQRVTARRAPTRHDQDQPP